MTPTTTTTAAAETVTCFCGAIQPAELVTDGILHCEACGEFHRIPRYFTAFKDIDGDWWFLDPNGLLTRKISKAAFFHFEESAEIHAAKRHGMQVWCLPS